MERQRRKKNFPPSFDASSIQGPIEAVEGHPIKLSLRVEGNPRPQVRWQVGRKRVKPSSKYRVDQDDQGMCTLVVNKSHKNLEEGVWAIATNDLGEDFCMIEVKVNEKENDGEESDLPRSVNFRRIEAIAETQQQFSPQRRRKNKIETENAPGKSGLVFGLQAKKKKTFSLSKSFELDEDKACKKANRIDRSMAGEFNFFRETSIQKPSDLTKIIQETRHASPPHVTAPRLLHKPPPLPARTKTNDSGITKKAQDKRKPLQNRWKKGVFGSNSFIATSSEVEINEDEDDDDEEPVEAVRLTKRRRKKLPSVNASFESSLSSVNSACLETNFDDCAPKLTEEKYSWQRETEFSNEDDDKLEADVIAQVNKLPSQQEDGDAWKMNGTEINRFCHDLLSNLQEINLTDYRQINNIPTQEEIKTSFGDSENSDSDFEMEAYCESPKRRHSLKIDSQIKSSPVLHSKSPEHEVEEAVQPSPPNQVGIHGIIPDEQILVENSPSASNDADYDEDNEEDDEEEEKEEEEVEKEDEEDEEEEEEEEEDVEEEGEKIERLESKETEEISRSEARGEVSTDEETREDSGSVAADESRHSTSSGSELDAGRESLEHSIEKETSDDDDSRENCNNDDENSLHVSDVNNNNDDDINNNGSKGNSSPVKSSAMQFIDTDESEEEWPAPPSAEVLNSLISRPSLFPMKHDNHNNAYNNNNNNNNNNSTESKNNTTPYAGNNNSTTAYNNNNSPTAVNKLPLIQADFSMFKERDKEKSNPSANFEPPVHKTNIHQLTNRTSPYSTRENRSPTYRDAILERAGTFGLTSSLKGLKSYMDGLAFKKVEFQVDQNDGDGYERESSFVNKTDAGETKSSLKWEPEIDRNFRNGGEFVRDERANFNSSPWQFEEPGKNRVEDKSERKSGEKKSVRFLEDDPKLSGSEIPRQRNVFKTFVQPEEHVCRPSHTTYTSSRWHDPTTNTRQFFSTNMPAQINGEKQTMRLAFDERHHAKKEARPNEDDMPSPVTVHEYGELISFGQPLLGECQKADTLDKLAERTINEVVTNKCTVREAVKNILKNRKECSERAPDNLWSQSYDGARLPQNVERRLENYPLFLSDSERQTKLLGREMAASRTRFHPGINNTSVKLPEPHFV